MEDRKNKLVSISVQIKSVKCWAVISIAIVCILLCVLAKASSKTMLILILPLVVLAPIRVECSPNTMRWLGTLWYLCAMPVVLFCTQLLLNQRVINLGPFKMAMGCLAVSTFINFILILTRKMKFSVAVGSVSLMLLTSVNYFVFSFRGSEFAPYDFLAFHTALDVAGQYQYDIEASFAYAWCVIADYIAFGYSIPKTEKCPIFSKNHIGFVCAELIVIAVLNIGLKSISKEEYRNNGAIRNGYLLNFVKKIDFKQIEVPAGYDVDSIVNCENAYNVNENFVAGPNVIVIMNESFADLRIMGDLRTNIEVTPFFDSLMDRTIHGYALASSIGGGTCNSEYTFLTGNNMGFFPDGVYPYQQYIKKPTWSIFTEMERRGYYTIATHPEQPTNWMRETVYPLFGIDASYFIDAYSQANLIRQHVSDQETYEKIIELYEDARQEQTKSVFLLGVTMQNHGGYEAEDFDSIVKLKEYSQEYPTVEQYLTLVHYSDQALEYLISYFEALSEPVVVLFFGDHLPAFPGTFYSELHNGGFETLEEQMLQYTVPFFVWANYEIEACDIGLTSLNFLSNYVYEAAGLPLPAYNEFMKEVQSVIPAMNAYGYYSKAQGTFVPYEQATGEEADILEKYQILQYNCMFDEENRSEIFFPTPDIEVP